MSPTAKDALFAGLGAVIGAIAGSATTPHYEDIDAGGANRTAVFGDVVGFRVGMGAVLGAIVGGLIAGATTDSAPVTVTS